MCVHPIKQGINNSIIIIILFQIICCNHPFGPKGADSAEHLKNLCKKYHSRKNVISMMRLYNKENVSKELIKTQRRMIKKYFNRNALSFEITEFGEKEKNFFNTIFEVQDQKIKYNLKIIGQISVIYEENYQEAFLFGKKDDKYFFGLQVNLKRIKD